MTYIHICIFSIFLIFIIINFIHTIYHFTKLLILSLRGWYTMINNRLWPQWIYRAHLVSKWWNCILRHHICSSIVQCCNSCLPWLWVIGCRLFCMLSYILLDIKRNLLLIHTNSYSNFWCLVNNFWFNFVHSVVRFFIWVLCYVFSLDSIEIFNINLVPWILFYR